MRNILNTKKLYDWQEKIDKELAEAVQAGACLYCGAKLHCGDYPRKPRGGPEWDERYSFDCSRCRKRRTPPSVRFLGRKVYVGARCPRGAVT